jgi:hypothetical protein
MSVIDIKSMIKPSFDRKNPTIAVLNRSYSDLAPSKKVTGGERQKAKGKRQNG